MKMILMNELYDYRINVLVNFFSSTEAVRMAGTLCKAHLEDWDIFLPP